MLRMSIMGLLVACSTSIEQASVERRLDGHVFDIPRANAIADSDTPFFLPELDPSDGFSFDLNPDAKLPERNLVGVANRMQTCARSEGTDAQINDTVCSKHPFSWRGRPLRKHGDDISWIYDLPMEPDGKRPPALVNCFAMVDPARSGLCTAPLPYGNLVLTIHLRDNQVGELAVLYDRSVASLQRWKR